MLPNCCAVSFPNVLKYFVNFLNFIINLSIEISYRIFRTTMDSVDPLINPKLTTLATP